MSQRVCLSVDLCTGTGWKGWREGHGSVTKQRENPMQKQTTSWLVQESGRGLELPKYLMWKGGP